MPPESQAVDLTISIVTWNNADDILPCLRSVLAERGDTRCEVIVVDNASTDGTPGIVRQHGSVRLIENDTNVGFAAAHTRAWEAARGRYWLLLNPDATLQPGALRALISFMERQACAGLVGPRIVDDGGRVQHCAQARPSVLLTLLEASRLHRLLPARWRGRLLLGSYFSHDVSTRVGWTWGTALLARRDAVAEVGALSDRFFMYGEDLEWALRMKRAGWEVWFCAEAEVRHRGAGSASLRWSDAQRRERILRGIDDAVRIHRGAAYLRALKVASLVALGLEAASRRLRSRRVGPELRTALGYHWRTLVDRAGEHRHPDA